MTKSTGTGYLRTHTRATNPSPRQAESALDRLASAVIGKVVAKDADQGQAFRDAQAVVVQPAGAHP
jgi:hypothetical protein